MRRGRDLHYPPSSLTLHVRHGFSRARTELSRNLETTAHPKTAGKDVPQGLNPHQPGLYGTAEAVPYVKRQGRPRERSVVERSADSLWRFKGRMQPAIG
jgi:hypothetical protein